MSASPPSSTSATRVAASLAAFAAAAGVLTLIGWAFEIRRFADWDLDGVAQMPNNALGVVAAGAALLCKIRGKRPAARALAAFAALIGAVTLVEHATDINLGIDTLILHRDWGQTGTVAPGRMGLPGSVTLLVLGVSTFLATFPRTRRAATSGGLLIVGIAMLSMIGYVFGASPLYAIPRLTTIALQTSALMLALGIALVAVVPDSSLMRHLLARSSAGVLVRRALPLILAVPVMLGWLRIEAQHAGLFDTEFGTAILVLTLIALLVAMLAWGATTVSVHEDALRENRDRLAAILGSITDAFLTVDADWRVVFANDAARGLVPDTTNEHLQRAMRERVNAGFEAFDESSGRWIAHRAYPTPDGGLAIIMRDVTERRRAEEKVRESEEKFALLFAKAAVGAALARLPEGVFVDVNESFVRIFGYTREEVIGKTSLELGINPNAKLRAQIIERLEREGEVHDLEMRLFNRAGEERVIINNVTLITIADQRYLLTTAQDITDRKAAEEALLAADRMKDEFLATLSHELRTPLTAIVGWAEMLLRMNLDDRDRALALETIRSSARAQAQLVDDVLDVSRIITGKMRLQREMTDLAAVLDAAVATVRPAAEGKRIALRVSAASALPPVLADAERIRQVIWNLLSNAIKFSDAGTTVDVELRREHDAAVIVVSDQGRGITPEFLPHVFDRFRQADSSSTRAHSGLGIGLALSKDLVELHGGTITAESKVNEGSRFTVRIPAPLARDERASAVSAPPLRATLDGLRVLYVDDREDARMLIGTMLRQRGAEVSEAESVDQALDALSRRTPDVVITDIAMPMRDGYELLQAIRADARWARLPVLALTAQARLGDEERAAVAGFHAFLRKPIESHELTRAIAGAVARVRA